MTRLDLLCKVHGVQGGTIHYFNAKYRVDFISMDDAKFKLCIKAIKKALRLSKTYGISMDPYIPLY